MLCFCNATLLRKLGNEETQNGSAMRTERERIHPAQQHQQRQCRQLSCITVFHFLFVWQCCHPCFDMYMLLHSSKALYIYGDTWFIWVFYFTGRPTWRCYASSYSDASNRSVRVCWLPSDLEDNLYVDHIEYIYVYDVQTFGESGRAASFKTITTTNYSLKVRESSRVTHVSTSIGGKSYTHINLNGTRRRQRYCRM